MLLFLIFSCGNTYGKTQVKQIGEYWVYFRHGKPRRITKKYFYDGKVSGEVVHYLIAWDNQEERELHKLAVELLDRSLMPESGGVVRGDLPEGRRLLEELGIVEDLNTIALKIITLVPAINDYFSSMTSKDVKILNENIRIVPELFTPCATQEDYVKKIGALAMLFEVKLDPLRNLITNPDSNWKSIKLIEAWLNENDVGHDPEILKIWSAIIDLRNATFPYHSSDSKVIEMVKFFGHDFPLDYCELWGSILLKFCYSLIKFNKTLTEVG